MSNPIKIDLPDNVKNLMQRVLNFGYEIYVVGGCVRDTLLHRKVADYDLTTNALPTHIIEIFSDCNVIETGLQHGTVTVVFNNEMFEITTFRIDGEYIDNRHPNKVTFTSSLFEDLSRRDFTINAMAADIDGNVIDFFDGIDDLEKKLIRCVGDPISRFNEDALRILRAFRFAAKINGTIESNTTYAMRKCAYLLTNIAAERVQKELNGFLLNGSSETKVRELIESIDVFRVVIPELDKLNIRQNLDNQKHQLLFEHVANVVAKVENDIVLKLAALFHDIGKESCYDEYPSATRHRLVLYTGHANVSAILAENILKRLRYPNDIIHQVTWLVKMHDYPVAANKISVKLLLNQSPSPVMFNKLIALMIANELDHKDSDIQKYVDILTLSLNIFKNDEAYTIKQLAVDGNDLIHLGLTGKQIGDTLSDILKANIEDLVENNKDSLLRYIKETIINA